MTDRMAVQNVLQGEWVELLAGIRGRPGVRGEPAQMGAGNIGIDMIELEPGRSFPSHTHSGAHVLYVLEGRGTLRFGDRTVETRPGDCYFVPADEVHAVGAIDRHRLLAIGYPHVPLDDSRRMRVVGDEHPDASSHSHQLPDLPRRSG